MKTDPLVLPVLKRSTWLEIDLDAILWNLTQLRQHVGPSVHIMPAMKANGYGHGMLKIVQALVEAGVDLITCGSLDDAIDLRENGVQVPILVFASNTVGEAASDYLQHRLIPTILSLDHARELAELSTEPVTVFVKCDTGRGRLGVLAEETPAFLKSLSEIPRIRIDGVYTHIADADWPDQGPEFASWQVNRFRAVKEEATRLGLQIPIWQIANSAAGIAMPDAHFSGCCAGRLLWGFSQLKGRPEHPQLRRALRSWKTRIIQKKKVTAGKFGPQDKSVRLDTPAWIAILAVGLHDGLDLKASQGTEVLVRGKRARIWSPIGLEHAVIDLATCPEAEVGDEVVLVGRQGNEEVTVNDLLRHWGRSLTQFLAYLNPNMVRVYYRDGKPVAYSNRKGCFDL